MHPASPVESDGEQRGTLLQSTGVSACDHTGDTRRHHWQSAKRDGMQRAAPVLVESREQTERLTVSQSAKRRCHRSASRGCASIRSSQAPAESSPSFDVADSIARSLVLVATAASRDPASIAELAAFILPSAVAMHPFLAFLAVFAGTAEFYSLILFFLVGGTVTVGWLCGLIALWPTAALAWGLTLALSKHYARGKANTARANLKGKVVLVTGGATGQ